MRELKFRAWDKKRKRYALHIMTTNTSCPYHDRMNMFKGVMTFSKWVLRRFIIEQYTGLKDKNGKEIYEGDIVEYIWDFCGEKRKNNYVVEWLSGKVEHYPYSVDSGFTLPDSVEGYYVVIGNIHENPELIGEEEE